MNAAIVAFAIFGFCVFVVFFVTAMLWLFCSGPESEDQYTEAILKKIKADKSGDKITQGNE